MRYYLTHCLMVLVLLLTAGACSGPPEEELPSFGFTAYLDTIIQDWEGQDVFVEEYRRLTGMDLRIIQPPHQQYMEKLMVSFSDVDAPQVCEVLPEYMSIMVSRNIAISLDDYIEGSRYISRFDPAFLDSLRAQDGKIYGFPFRDGGACVTYVRKDWLDRLGMEAPRTWDDFYRMLEAFTHGDPDGNGLDDTRGYTDVNCASEDWYNRAILLDARAEIYFKDGKWIDGFTEPAMEKALERLRKIYREGLTDPNLITNTTFTARNRFISGDVGVFTYWGNHWARNLLERTRDVAGPEAHIIVLPPLDGGYYIRRAAPLLIITTGTESPQRIFNNFFDRQFDQDRMQILFTYGVRGYHWDYVDGEIKFLVNRNDPYLAPFTKAFVPPVSVINDWDQPMKPDEVIEPVLDVLEGNTVNQRIRFGKSYYDRYYLEIERDLKPEIMSRIMTGELEIREGLQLYKKRSSELYLDKILDELNGSI